MYCWHRHVEVHAVRSLELLTGHSVLYAPLITGEEVCPLFVPERDERRANAFVMILVTSTKRYGRSISCRFLRLCMKQYVSRWMSCQKSEEDELTILCASCELPKCPREAERIATHRLFLRACRIPEKRASLACYSRGSRGSL